MAGPQMTPSIGCCLQNLWVSVRRTAQVKLFHEFSLQFQLFVFEFVLLYTELDFS